MRVLVTDGAMNKSLAVVRAVSDEATVGVSSRFPVSPAGVSRDADAQHWIRDRSPRAYVDALDRIVRREGYDQVLPVGGNSFDAVSRYRDRIDAPVDDILPDRDAMDAAIDKRETYELAEREGVPSPVSVSLSDAADIEAVVDDVGLPAVIKSGTETEARFVRRVDSIDELRRAYRAYREDHESDPVVQEYLPGQSRGYFGMFVDGELIDGYAHRRIREYPPEGGASACAVSISDETLREYSQSLLGALDWTGVAMVEFKEDADGTPKVVEINPKFWGSLDLAIASGMNFPKALLRHTAGRDDFDFDFEPQRVHWPLSGDFTHAWRRPESAREVFWDVVSDGTRSNVRVTDPLPHVLEAMVTLLRRDL